MIRLEIYRTDLEGNEIKGIGLPVFLLNSFLASENRYDFEIIAVYEDGVINCNGDMDFDGFKEKVKSGQIVTLPPARATIQVGGLVEAKVVTPEESGWFVKLEEFVKQIEDTILQLQGKRTSSDNCRYAFEKYLYEPTPSRRAKLRDAYERVPEHLRIFVLHHMDIKDKPIRQIISGQALTMDQLGFLKEEFTGISRTK
ncbi:MAG: DUF7638 domain-containing protein [Bacteroidota bacterium]